MHHGACDLRHIIFPSDQLTVLLIDLDSWDTFTISLFSSAERLQKIILKNVYLFFAESAKDCISSSSD